MLATISKEIMYFVRNLFAVRATPYEKDPETETEGS
jgi:hypothetical protein